MSTWPLWKHIAYMVLIVAISFCTSKIFWIYWLRRRGHECLGERMHGATQALSFIALHQDKVGRLPEYGDVESFLMELLNSREQALLDTLRSDDVPEHIAILRLEEPPK